MGLARLVTRRRALFVGLGALGGVAIAGVAGLELVDHGVLPGKSLLNQLDGACDVTVPKFDLRPVGQTRSGTFYSRHRHRTVGYTLGYPPGYSDGDAIPLVVMLHGEGGTHRHALAGLTPAQAVALIVDGTPLAPMALATVDGGRGYWHPHPGDDPMGMVVDELIPMLQSQGLGRTPRSTGVMGISMGGYGAHSCSLSTTRTSSAPWLPSLRRSGRRTRKPRRSTPRRTTMRRSSPVTTS